MIRRKCLEEQRQTNRKLLKELTLAGLNARLFHAITNEFTSISHNKTNLKNHTDKRFDPENETPKQK